MQTLSAYRYPAYDIKTVFKFLNDAVIHKSGINSGIMSAVLKFESQKALAHIILVIKRRNTQGEIVSLLSAGRTSARQSIKAFLAYSQILNYPSAERTLVWIQQIQQNS